MVFQATPPRTRPGLNRLHRLDVLTPWGFRVVQVSRSLQECLPMDSHGSPRVTARFSMCLWGSQKSLGFSRDFWFPALVTRYGGPPCPSYWFPAVVVLLACPLDSSRFPALVARCGVVVVLLARPLGYSSLWYSLPAPFSFLRFPTLVARCDGPPRSPPLIPRGSPPWLPAVEILLGRPPCFPRFPVLVARCGGPPRPPPLITRGSPLWLARCGDPPRPPPLVPRGFTLVAVLCARSPWFLSL